MSEKKPTRKTSGSSGKPPVKGKAVQKSPSGKPVAKKGVNSAQPKGADLVAERRSFFTSSLFWSKVRTIVSGSSAVLLLGLGAFFAFTSKTTVFFQIDDQHRIVDLVPLSQPRHSDAFVGDWLNKCMVKTFDFYYGNIDRHLSSMKGECYNDAGFNSLMAGLRSTGNYTAIKEKELFSAFSFSETPTVVRTKSDAGAPYKWMLQGEGVLTLKTTSRSYPQQATITAIVTRSSLLDDSIGLSIEKILLKTSRIGN